jgi:formyltetrahydrofolate hydrolase
MVLTIPPTSKTAILLIDCPDRKGIIVTIVNFRIQALGRKTR